MNIEKKKVILPVVIIIILAILGLAGYLIFFRNNNQAKGGTIISDISEEKTEAVVSLKAQDYAEAVKFKDYRAEYKLIDNKTKNAITEDEYIKRQQWLDNNTVAGIVEVKEIKVGTVSITDDNAEVRMTINASTGEYNNMYKFIYEDGKWHKLFENWDTLSIGKSWEEFISANQ